MLFMIDLSHWLFSICIFLFQDASPLYAKLPSLEDLYMDFSYPRQMTTTTQAPDVTLTASLLAQWDIEASDKLLLLSNRQIAYIEPDCFLIYDKATSLDLNTNRLKSISQ